MLRWPVAVHGRFCCDLLLSLTHMMYLMSHEWTRRASRNSLNALSIPNTRYNQMPQQAARSLPRSLQGKLAPRLMTGEKRSLFRPFCQRGTACRASKHRTCRRSIVFIRRGGRTSSSSNTNCTFFHLKGDGFAAAAARVFAPAHVRHARVPRMINISHERSLQLRYLPLPISLSNH